MGNRSIVGTGSLASASVLALAMTAPSRANFINFDVDPGGNPIVAPQFFSATTALRNTYTPLGVTFAGPGALDGGAILNQASNFGVQPRSGLNFLAFNRGSALQDGGVPRDPETLTFSAPVGAVSIYASGGGEGTTFRMEAFTPGGIGVGSVTQNSPVGGYVQLSIPNPTQPIGRVTLTEIGGDDAFVYDDLEFTVIPEPATVGAALAAGCLLVRRRR